MQLNDKDENEQIQYMKTKIRNMYVCKLQSIAEASLAAQIVSQSCKMQLAETVEQFA